MTTDLGFVRAAVLLHALTTVCVDILSISTTFEIMKFFSEIMLRVLVFFAVALSDPLC